MLRKVVPGPKEQEQKSPTGGFLQCFSRGDADLILPVVQWDSAVPRTGEFMVLGSCVVVSSAMATRAPHTSSCGRCWVLLHVRLENTARFMRGVWRAGAELPGIALEAAGIQGLSCPAGAGKQDKVIAGDQSQLHSSSIAPEAATTGEDNTSLVFYL